MTIRAYLKRRVRMLTAICVGAVLLMVVIEETMPGASWWVFLPFWAVAIVSGFMTYDVDCPSCGSNVWLDARYLAFGGSDSRVAHCAACGVHLDTPMQDVR